MTDGYEAATPLDDADPVCRLSAAELAEAYASLGLSPVEAVTACLARAEAVQARCNAFTRIDHAGALAAARASEERWRRGTPLSPLDGIPTTLKDMVRVRDWVVRYGSPTTPDEPCAEDAPAVAGLRAVGAVFLGQTTTPEFGWKAVTDGRLTGITRNPWNLAMTPGGSSGGAAVAAAAGAGVLHLGTDGGGSIRIPACFTGITGLKPSYGRVPAYPASPFGTVAHLGPMARRAGDAALMLGAMAGRDPDDWLQGPGRLPELDAAPEAFAGARIGFWSAPPSGRLDPEVGAVVSNVVRDLERLGAKVEPVDLPDEGLFETFTAHWYAGAANRVASLPEAARWELDPGLRQIAEAGARLGAVDYLRAMDARAGFGRRMDALLGRFDILVSPACAVTAFAAGAEVPPGSGLSRWIEWAGFSFPLNLSQQPAVSVPCGRIRGLPVGLQIVGARGADARVLGFAAAFEDAFPEHVL
ncbi:MAG TPA: amidase [Lichenihabitans sp.]|jgi:amidase/aspartyl-tRNA(Asn)/glutamyl-tRNA(Gln) amidotransferase subunit A|nr:amidase [Lichenihabitans sp.]